MKTLVGRSDSTVTVGNVKKVIHNRNSITTGFLSLIRNDIPDCIGSTNKTATVFIIHWFCVSAGLCDINEGTVVPEDRCKSPTSGNHNFL